jgi:long-chain acyl-CoA synthetase
MLIGNNLHRHAAEHPDKPALICNNEILNWRDLAHLVDALCHWLDARVPVGCGIALVLPNSIALPVLVLAIARSGRVAQVFDPAWPDRIVRRTLIDNDSAFAFVAAGHDAISPPVVELGERRPLDTLRALCGGYDNEYKVDVSSDAPFYTGYTSGSTGRPKGYRRSHRSWTASFAIEAAEFGHTSEDVIAAPGSLSHSLFLYAAIHALHIGATAIISRSFRPAKVVTAMQRHAATILYAVPAQLMMLARVPQQQVCDCVRWVISSGSKWHGGDRQILRRNFPSAGFAEFYGASELSFVSVAREEECPPPGSVGRAFTCVDIRIMDEAGKPLPAGRTGEVFVRSPMVFDGYAGEKQQTGIRRTEDFLSVGDMGRIDGRGFLFLAGRRDRMIVTAGKNLFPEEIEAVLLSHPDVASATVVALEDAKRGARIAAVLQLQEGVALSPSQLIAHAREYLPLYKVPRLYFTLQDWPQTRSGKVDLVVLKQCLANGMCEPLR